MLNIIVLQNPELSNVLAQYFSHIPIVSTSYHSFLQQDRSNLNSIYIANKSLLHEHVDQVNLVVYQFPIKIRLLIEAIESKINEIQKEYYIFDNKAILYKRQKKVVYGELEVNLTEKESELLYSVVALKITNKKDLLRKIWGYSNNVETKTIETHLHNLRNKLPFISLDTVKLD